ncbi:MAG: T9SS type A sorting domain-containing protein [Bacteroidetes bacterium]|nr:T9SS type A sorting domain-containing protein [Bacteroidota bacterium]
MRWNNDRILPIVYSRNALIAAEKVNYQEPINLPDEQFAGSVRSGSGKISKASAQRSSLSVFPNPAHTHIVVSYETTASAKNLSLSIIDKIGRKIQTIDLTKSIDQIVIPLDAYPSGIYIY